jgi:hypothetical protein
LRAVCLDDVDELDLGLEPPEAHTPPQDHRDQRLSIHVHVGGSSLTLWAHDASKLRMVGDRLLAAADALDAANVARVKRARCPTCDSPDPARHPAMQFEGEVQPCLDPWHEQEVRRG